MEFNVAQLLKEHVGATREYDVDTEFYGEEPEDLVGVGSVVGHVKFIRTNRGVLVQARLRSSVEITCGRCLEPFRHPIEVQVEEEFFPTIDVFTGLPAPIPEDELGFTIDANHILDISEAVRQYLIVALPMQPICSVGCRGLCPMCGQNLNEANCNCVVSTGGQRFAVLGELLRDENSAQDKKGAG